MLRATKPKYSKYEDGSVSDTDVQWTQANNEIKVDRPVSSETVHQN